MVKIKGEPAAMLYEAMTAPTVAEDCRLRGCLRRGVSVTCSTLNLRDPVVCELRVRPDGTLLPPESLYHSAEDNRNYGQTTHTGAILSLDGEARGTLSDWTGHAAVGLRIVDPAEGKLVLEPVP